MSGAEVADSSSLRVSATNGEALSKRGTISNFAAAAAETTEDWESPLAGAEDPVAGLSTHFDFCRRRYGGDG